MASRALKNRPDVHKKSPLPGVLMALSVVGVVCVALYTGLMALGNSWLDVETLPSYDNLDKLNTAHRTNVTGGVDQEVRLAEYQAENREPVTLDEVSPYVLKGTVATEDERFYDHRGFDLWGIARAAIVNLTGQGREGASTITQQFVRNTILSDEATEISFARKIREMYLAMKIEEQYSKDEILRLYLNTINYGKATYGIEAAAQRYFSKPALDLTLVEAATLIGIPQSPTYNNPIDNPEGCVARRNVVLDRMLSNNVITPEEHAEAQAAPLELNETLAAIEGIYAYPYFTSYVRDQLKNTCNFSDAEVMGGGFTVETTLDVAMQDKAERAVANKEAGINPDYSVALTAIDPATGEVKAMVGGKDYYDTDNPSSKFNLAADAERQTGSSFKTFTLVAALEAGISPQTLVNCSSKVTIGNWSPQNINGNNYGTQTLAGAVKLSSNTGFARLIAALGPEKVVEVARRMGLEKANLPNTLSLTLGSGGVSTLEMADAYATLASGGIQRGPIVIKRVLGPDGSVRWEPPRDERQALSPEIAGAATKVLQGVLQPGGTGTDAALFSGQPAAGKTGTSDDGSDSWFCGYTPQLSVAIWLGDPRDYAVGTKIPDSLDASSVFREFVGSVLEGQPIVQFKTATDPAYKPYINERFGIGVKPPEPKKEEEEEEEEPEEEPAPAPEPTPPPAAAPDSKPPADSNPPPLPDPEPKPDPNGPNGTPPPQT